ncbi:MAG: LysR family transcriptional regulator [Myxococcales bacterium]|nr:LysR family transcriptional regulator [Myxococcales bacterium]
MADPSDMILFATVVREGGFTAAARVLHITKQSVSDRVGRLERSLGVRLLERTTRRVRPTEVGVAYAARCTALAALVEDADREALARHLEPTGLLRVSGPVAFGRRVLVPVAHGLLAQHPGLTIDVDLSDRMVHVLDEGFDVVIRVGPLADSSLTARRLGAVRLVVVASPRLRPLPKAPAGLVSCPCVATSADERWSVRGEWLRIRARLVVNDLDAALEACLLGSGVARLPDRLVEPALRSGALVELFAERVATNFAPVHALVPSGRFQPAKVRVFLDALEAAMAPAGASRRARARPRST